MTCGPSAPTPPSSPSTRRRAGVLDATVFHPQGGGQPADKGIISASGARFLVEDVRTKDGVVFHYRRFGGSGEGCWHEFNEGENVSLEIEQKHAAWKFQTYKTWPCLIEYEQANKWLSDQASFCRASVGHLYEQCRSVSSRTWERLSFS